MIGTLVFALSLCAGEWDVYFKAEIATELRQFESDDDMRTIDSGTAGFVRLETSLKRGAFSVAARGFGRVDPKDHDRDNASFEELFLSIDDRGWRVRAGYQMLNWTATEAFHPADVMNARNFDSDIENPEKKGELMLSVRRRLPVGSIEAFYMPRMERPELPGSRSRLSFAPPGFSTSEPLWLDDNGNLDTSDSRFQWGLRWNVGVEHLAKTGKIHFALADQLHRYRWRAVTWLVILEGVLGQGLVVKFLGVTAGQIV